MGRTKVTCQILVMKMKLIQVFYFYFIFMYLILLYIIQSFSLTTNVIENEYLSNKSSKSHQVGNRKDGKLLIFKNCQPQLISHWCL